MSINECVRRALLDNLLDKFKCTEISVEVEFNPTEKTMILLQDSSKTLNFVREE